MVDVKLEIEGVSDVPLRVAEPDGAKLGLDVPYVGGGGTRDYERLDNKPRIEEVELVGNKELEDFGMDIASNYDIAMLFK